MPRCWGWSPLHASSVGCRSPTEAEGHCQRCRALCGYTLEDAAAAANGGAASGFCAIAPLAAELLVEGVVGSDLSAATAPATSARGPDDDKENLCALLAAAPAADEQRCRPGRSSESEPGLRADVAPVVAKYVERSARSRRARAIAAGIARTRGC